MKKVLVGLLLVATAASAADKVKAKRDPAQNGTGNVGAAFAHNIENGLAAQKGPREPQKDLTINPARVDSVTTLVNKAIGKDAINLQVKVIVHSSGGSTDVSPRKKITFGIYSENEMFDVISSYDIGQAFSVKSARRVSGGIYEISGFFTYDQYMSKKTGLIYVDAVKVINELENLKSGEFGEVADLKSPVTVTTKP